MGNLRQFAPKKDYSCSFVFIHVYSCFSFFNMRSALPLLQSVATKRIIMNDARIITNNFWEIHGQFTAIRVQKIFVFIHVYSCVFVFKKKYYRFSELSWQKAVDVFSCFSARKGAFCPGKRHQGEEGKAVLDVICGRLVGKKRQTGAQYAAFCEAICGRRAGRL